MPYFLLRTPQGSVEVFASDLQQAIDLAGGNDPGLVGQIALDPSVPVSGTLQPSGAPTTPAIGFTRGQGGEPTTPVTGFTPGQGGGRASFLATPEIQAMLPEAAFREGLRRSGRDPEGVFGDIYRQQEAPTAAAYIFENFLKGNALDALNDPGAAGFGSYTAAQTGNIYDKARDLFGRVGGYVPGAADPNVANYEAIRSYSPANTNPQETELRRHLRNLAQAGARSRWGAGLFDILGPNEQRVQRGLQDVEFANTAAGTRTDPWAYYRQRFGI